MGSGARVLTPGFTQYCDFRARLDASLSVTPLKHSREESRVSGIGGTGRTKRRQACTRLIREHWPPKRRSYVAVCEQLPSAMVSQPARTNSRLDKTWGSVTSDRLRVDGLREVWPEFCMRPVCDVRSFATMAFPRGRLGPAIGRLRASRQQACRSGFHPRPFLSRSSLAHRRPLQGHILHRCDLGRQRQSRRRSYELWLRDLSQIFPPRAPCFQRVQRPQSGHSVDCRPPW